MYAVILAGGSGTRFWPLSREATPKQLLRVFGDTTMIQQTVSRLNDLIPVENVFVITGRKYSYDIKRQLAETCGSEKFRILVEPEGKNTAPAVGLAAVYISKISKDAVMAVMPSDHVITKNEVFIAAIRKAGSLARKGYLVTIGIEPDRPETGYGYIKKGSQIKTRSLKSEACLPVGKVQSSQINAYIVDQFCEKPSLEKAGEFLKSGEYLWNAGIFIWRAEDILAELRKQMPGLYSGLMKIGKAIGRKNEQDVVSSVFKSFESVSIDYGVMEHAAKVAVVSADMGWSDVGTWCALEDIAQKDHDKNIISGNVINIGSKNSIIYGGKRLIATVGLDSTVIVDTPDATLICNKNNTQDVKKVVDKLREKGSGEVVEHVTSNRPWGSYTVLETAPRFKIKKIVVKPGAKLSHQLHHHRSEHWVVVSGTALVTVGEKTYNVHPNESTYVPISCRHRLENPGKVPLHLIEVQIGDYIEEDDIVRLDDVYGRQQ